MSSSKQGFELRLIPEKLADPFAWRPRRIFVNSMSDLFHEAVPEPYIADVFEVMRQADWHVYQVLTKRAVRIRQLLCDPQSLCARQLLDNDKPLRHVWLGVSVENRRHGLPRLEELRQTPAALRFLSIEPLLEDLGELDLAGIGWVIAGGESGPGARPMRPEWVRSLRDQCRAAGVPFFFKQWGGVRKHQTGRLLDGELHDALPPFSGAPCPSISERRRRAASFHSERSLSGAAPAVS